MKKVALKTPLVARTVGVALGLWLAANLSASAQFVSGQIRNNSSWADNVLALTPPGDGNGTGQIAVGLWSSSTIIDAPQYYQSVASGTMPLSGSFPYLVTAATNGSFLIVAWVDANSDGKYDQGEPRSVPQTVTLQTNTSIASFNLIILDDSDSDLLPDWWEVHWFANCADPLGKVGAVDYDGDGLTSLQEYNISVSPNSPGMSLINPANWDTDGDGMDDKWEYDHYDKDLGIGLNPTISNKIEDIDGDGLSSWQEYCGVDGQPLMIFDSVQECIIAGKQTGSTNAMNPLDIDSDYDLLIDSYEAGWYDPSNNISPTLGLTTNSPATAFELRFDTAAADPDNDGLSNYREMCLLSEFHEGGANGDKWDWDQDYPIVYSVYHTDDGQEVRVNLMSSTGSDLNLGVNGNQVVNTFGNLAALRNHAWTDPSDGTGYVESQTPGHDTDNDFLPDGWEVEFNLDPRDAGPTFPFTNGPFGDPDGDGLLNFEEFLGQDGNRFTTRPYINGTGDETNPNLHNTRPDSTYAWRWYATNTFSRKTDPRTGLGINRAETLGSALPTASIGADAGLDSDDDGRTDLEEIGGSATTLSTCPVSSTDPFHPMCVVVTNTAGILIPDPEPAPATVNFAAGTREDLIRRDWTIECYVKLTSGNMSGDLFNYQTILGSSGRTVYRLSLSNNAPVLSAQNSGATTFTVSANPLPTNQWIHLAAVWDRGNNVLALYIQGVLYQGSGVFGLSPADAGYPPATNVLAFGASPDGSFVNKLYLDEIRIWGIARTARQISDFARQLTSQNNGDDFWIDDKSERGALQLFNDRRAGKRDIILVNGGSLFAGEHGVLITNAVCSFRNQDPQAPSTWGIYTEGEAVWIDNNGDSKYTAQQDTLLRNASFLAEGELGAALYAVTNSTTLAQVAWNDKDGSGTPTFDSLLAYYRFDDGGTTAEDFARKAKSGLLGASAENYSFGDFGYALSSGFAWVTNDAAPTLGVDVRGADDSDGDGLPDAWELVMNLDPYDDGTGGETTPGLKNGPNGATGDPDNDGLNNIYEFWSDTNPRGADSDGDGISDALEDRDGDGVGNATEQQLGSRPDLIDTDDDGLTDSEEQGTGSNPGEATDPPLSRSMCFGGAPSDYLDVPISVDQRLTTWTLECLVNPTNIASGPGTLIRRVVQNLPGGSNVINYVIGLEDNGAGGLRVYAGYIYPTGTPFIIRGGNVPVGTFTHVGASYNDRATLTVYVNGQPVASTNKFSLPPLDTGKGGDVFLRIGENFGGYMDEVRIWKTSLSQGFIATNFNNSVDSVNTNLIHYFRFDDSQANTNIFPFGTYHQPHGPQDYKFTADWNAQWRHAAVIHGNVTFFDQGGIQPPPSLRVTLNPSDAVSAGAKWILDGGSPIDSGQTLISLTAGQHSLSFTPVSGYVAPPNEIIALTNGTVSSLTREYVVEGTLRITLQPTAVKSNGAWRVDGGEFFGTDIVVPLAPGSHLVTYGLVTGWTPPSNETVVVQSATATELTRFYKGDLDGDGMPDDWEALYGLNPNVNDANLDADGDGLTNIQEYQLGTNPINPDTDGDGFSDLTELIRGSNPLDPNSVPPKMEVNDFDGDGASDITVFWPQAGNWYIRQSFAGLRTRNWGFSQTIPVPADYNGDDVTDIAVFWPTNGTWYILLSGQPTDLSRQVKWVGGDVRPVPGDYNGDNVTDFAVYKPSLGNWYIAFNVASSNNTPTASLQWGFSETTPVQGDYDGDGVTDIAVYWPQKGYWYILKSSTGRMYGDNPFQWGWSETIPVPGDYDNDRVTDIAVYHQASGSWYIHKSSDGGLMTVQWGWSAARPVPGDYDNDGATDIAVYYQQGGMWYIRKSSDGSMFTGAPIQFGWSAAFPPGAPGTE